LDNSLFWLGIHDFLNNHSYGIKTTKALNVHLNKYSTELPEFEPSNAFNCYVNQPALLLPHSKGVPAGFRTVESPHTKNVQTITYGTVRAAQLQSQKPFNKNQQPSEIAIPDEIHTLEIYAPVIDVPIHLKTDKKLSMYSMIPGKAQHYFQKVL